MKNIIIGTLFILLCWNVGLCQSECERAFHRLNAKDISLRTSTLVITDLSQNCDLSELKGENSTLEKSSSDLRSRTNKGLASQDPSTQAKIIKEARANLLISKLNADMERVFSRSKQDDYGWVERIGGGMLGMAAAAKGCVGLKNPLAIAGCELAAGVGAGVAAEAANDLYKKHIEDETDASIKRKYLIILGDLKRKGFPVEKCAEGDFDCLGKIIDDAKGSLNDKRIIAQTAKLIIEETGLNNIPENIATKEDVAEAKRVVIQEARRTRKVVEENHLETLNAMSGLSEDMEEMMNEIAAFQEEVRKNHVEMNGKLDILIINDELLLANDELIIGTLNEHSALLQQNAIDNAITTDILIGQLSSSKQVQYYDLCLSGKEGCPSGLKKLFEDKPEKFKAQKERLEKIAKVEKFIAVSNQISEALDVGYNLAVELGLEGSAQEYVAKGISYTKTGLGIGNGVGQLVSGNYIQGALTILKGITSILGVGGEPQPSPELQAIMQLNEQMNQRFDIVDKKLESIISLQIELHKDLSRNIKANRELMQYRFNNIDYQLAEIINNQNIIQSQLRTLLEQDLNNCFSLLNRVINENPTLADLNTYQDYVDLYNVDKVACGDCMEGIKNWLNLTASNTSELRLDYFTAERESSDYFAQEYDTFKKMATFFRWYYGPSTGIDDLDAALQMLMVPTRVVDENLNLYCELRNVALERDITPEEALNDIYYLDPYAFSDFATIYSIFYPYFEIQDTEGNNPYQPFALQDYVEFTASRSETNIVAARKKLIDNQVASLFRIARIIRTQQALMSGNMLIEPFYHIIYRKQLDEQTINYNSLNMTPKQLAIDILANNPVMAQNFATYVIRKNYRFNEYIYKDPSVIDDAPINPNYDKFINYAYDNTNPRVFVPGRDSFYIDTTTILGVDVNELAKFSYQDEMKFTKVAFDDINSDVKEFAVLDLKVTDEDCVLSDFIQCSTNIPVPDKGILETNDFAFTNGLQFSGDISLLLDALETDIKFPDGVVDNWLEQTQLKLIILNNANQ